MTAFSALRVAVGIRFSWSAFSVEAIVAVCVLMSSLLLATVIVSLIVPTSNTALTTPGAFGAIRIQTPTS